MTPQTFTAITHAMQTRVHLPWKTLSRVIMSVVFGKRTRGDDKYVKMMFETAEEFLTSFVPGSYLCDSFPVLAKLPSFMQWWKPAGVAQYNKTVGYSPALPSSLKKDV